MEKPISRREFTHRFFTTTILAVGAADPWLGRAVAEVGAAAVTDGVMLVRLSDYPALNQTIGSVRIGVNPVGNDDFPEGRFYPVLINRVMNGALYVLSSRCTHASCVVKAYNLSQQAMACNCHGSQYNLDGSNKVKVDQSQGPLQPLTYVRQGDVLRITVPNMAFSLRDSLVPGGASQRVKLTWRTFREVTYEVFFRSSFNPGATWQKVNFALTPTGTINQAQFVGTDGEESIYVAPTSSQGFYEIRMKIVTV